MNPNFTGMKIRETKETENITFRWSSNHPKVILGSSVLINSIFGSITLYPVIFPEQEMPTNSTDNHWNGGILWHQPTIINAPSLTPPNEYRYSSILISIHLHNVANRSLLLTTGYNGVPFRNNICQQRRQCWIIMEITGPPK